MQRALADAYVVLISINIKKKIKRHKLSGWLNQTPTKFQFGHCYCCAVLFGFYWKIVCTVQKTSSFVCLSTTCHSLSILAENSPMGTNDSAKHYFDFVGIVVMLHCRQPMSFFLSLFSRSLSLSCFLFFCRERTTASSLHALFHLGSLQS